MFCIVSHFQRGAGADACFSKSLEGLRVAPHTRHLAHTHSSHSDEAQGGLSTLRPPHHPADAVLATLTPSKLKPVAQNSGVFTRQAQVGRVPGGFLRPCAQTRRAACRRSQPGGLSCPRAVGQTQGSGLGVRSRWPRGVAPSIPEQCCDFLAKFPRQLQALRLQAARSGCSSHSPISTGELPITAPSRYPPAQPWLPSQGAVQAPWAQGHSEHWGCGSNLLPPGPGLILPAPGLGVEPAPQLWKSRFSLCPTGIVEVERKMELFPLWDFPVSHAALWDMHGGGDNAASPGQVPGGASS